VVAAMWMGPIEVRVPGGRRLARAAGWSPEADARAQPEVVGVALLMAALTIATGVFPEPLFELVRDVGTSLSSFV